MKIFTTTFFLSLLPFLTSGQLCSGSLGDPVVNITFGSGSDPGPALAPGVTSYLYVAKDCPTDGEYTLRHSSANCFGNTWYTVPDDHTPNDASGYYMLVNASYSPGDFYVDTIRGLCGSTTYEFAAWIMNVLRPSACSFSGIDPNLTFTIENTNGIVLAVYNSGNITEGNNATWQQFGLFFQTPPGSTNVVVRITNNAPGGCGNDLALDDITFRPCGPLVDAVVVSNGTSTLDLCEGDNTSFLFSATYSAGFSTPRFQWQSSINNGTSWNDIAGASSTNYVRQPTARGVYNYRMVMAESNNFNSPQCRIASNTITVNVNVKPVAIIQNEVEACYATDVSVFAQGGTTFQWSGPNGFFSNNQGFTIQKIQYSNAGLYQVIVTNDKGCSDTGATNVLVNPNPIASVGPDQEVCEGTPTSLSATGGLRYTWLPSTYLSSDNVADPIATALDSILYKVIVYNQYGCKDSAITAVNVWKKPSANAGPDKITKEGVPVKLIGTVKGTDVTHRWYPSNFLDDPLSLQPVANPPENIYYRLDAISTHGCGIGSDEVLVKVYPKVIVPNVFSPNGDGINDTWNIKRLEIYEESETFVYNRYGQLVFHSSGYPVPWNGTRNGAPLSIGVYYYIIDLKVNNEPKLSGSLLILR